VRSIDERQEVALEAVDGDLLKPTIADKDPVPSCKKPDWDKACRTAGVQQGQNKDSRDNITITFWDC
jgi:hypothetical protein